MTTANLSKKGFEALSTHFSNDIDIDTIAQNWGEYTSLSKYNVTSSYRPFYDIADLSTYNRVIIIPGTIRFLVYEPKNLPVIKDWRYFTKYNILSTGLITLREYLGSDKNIMIPPTFNGVPVASLGGYLFEDSISIESIVLPNSIAHIGPRAFKNCKNLKQVTITGHKLTNIRDETFWGCSSLTSVIIPNQLKRIGPWAFSGCNLLDDQTLNRLYSIYKKGKSAGDLRWIIHHLD